MRIFVCFILSVGLFSCSPARFVKPLNKSQHAVDVSVGGPLFKLDKTTIPMPFLTTTYGYGIDSTITGFGSLNITSALYGNLQLELGVTKLLTKQQGWIPAISAIPVFNIMYRTKDAAKLYPQLDLYAFWEYGSHNNLFYAGVSNWFELAGKRTMEQEQSNHWIYIPVAGHTFSSKKWKVNIEAKIIAPNLSNEKLVIEYQTPFKNNGAFGVYVGYTRKF